MYFILADMTRDVIRAFGHDGTFHIDRITMTSEKDKYGQEHIHVAFDGNEVFHYEFYVPDSLKGYVDGKWKDEVIFALHRCIELPQLKRSRNSKIDGQKHKTLKRYITYYVENFGETFDDLNQRIKKYNPIVQILKDKEHQIKIICDSDNFASYYYPNTFKTKDGLNQKLAFRSGAWMFALKEAIYEKFNLAMEDTKAQVNQFAEELQFDRKNCQTVSSFKGSQQKDTLNYAVLQEYLKELLYNMVRDIAVQCGTGKRAIIEGKLIDWDTIQWQYKTQGIELYFEHYRKIARVLFNGVEVFSHREFPNSWRKDIVCIDGEWKNKLFELHRSVNFPKELSKEMSDPDHFFQEFFFFEDDVCKIALYLKDNLDEFNAILNKYYPSLSIRIKEKEHPMLYPYDIYIVSFDNKEYSVLVRDGTHYLDDEHQKMRGNQMHDFKGGAWVFAFFDAMYEALDLKLTAMKSDFDSYVTSEDFITKLPQKNS